MRLNKIILILFFSIFLSLVFYSRSLIWNDSLSTSKSGWRYNSRIVCFGLGSQNSDFERISDLKAASDYTISSIKAFNPLYLKLEFFVSKHFGIGAAINYNYMSFYYSYNVIKSNQNVVVKKPAGYDVLTTNIRANYHFFDEKKIDLYLGAGVGLRIVENNRTTNMKELSSGFAKETELTVGLRYLIKGVFGVYAEAGLTRSVIQAGISYNLNKRY